MTRNKTLGRCGVALLSAAAAVSLAGCSNPVSALQQTFGTPSVAEARAKQAAAVPAQLSAPTIIKDGTLTVGLDTSASVPRCLTSHDGSMQGYDIDMACAVADELGLQVEFVSVSNASQALGQTCDVVMGTSASSTGGVTVVGAYVEDAVGFFHKGSEQVAAKEDLVGKTIGVQDGSTSQQLLKRSDLEARQESFENLNDAFDALEQGIVDYVLCDAFSGAYLQAGYGDIAFCGSLNVPQSVGVGVAATNTELQSAVKAAVDKVTSDGVSDVIRSRWLGGLTPLGDASQVSGIEVSAGTVEGATSDTTEVEGAASGVQDGSTAGTNAADIAG